MIFLSLPLYKGQTITTLAEKGFRALCTVVLEVSKQTMVKKAARNKKWQSGIKMAEKGPKKFSRFMRHFPTTFCIEISKNCMANQ